MADLADNTFDFTFEEVFEFGLTRLHDGFAAFLEAPERSEPDRET